MNFKMLLDSTITFSDSAILRRIVGIASARRPCWLLTHHTSAAPATKNRDVSDSPDRSCSSEIDQLWSSVAQSHNSPLREHTPCPYCVIFIAFHAYSGRVAINPATTLVFPTLRECPPTTTIAIIFSRSEEHRLNSSHVAISYAVFCLKKTNNIK